MGSWGWSAAGAADVGTDCDTARAAHDSNSTNEIVVNIAGDRDWLDTLDGRREIVPMSYVIGASPSDVNSRRIVHFIGVAPNCQEADYFTRASPLASHSHQLMTDWTETTEIDTALQLRPNGLRERQQIVKVGADDRVEHIQVEFAVLMNRKVAKTHNAAAR